jgi:hypothetical protein
MAAQTKKTELPPVLHVRLDEEERRVLQASADELFITLNAEIRRRLMISLRDDGRLAQSEAPHR